MAPRAGYAALTLWLSPSVSKPSYEGGNGPVSEADARTRTGVDPFITRVVERRGCLLIEAPPA